MLKDVGEDNRTILKPISNNLSVRMWTDYSLMIGYTKVRTSCEHDIEHSGVIRGGTFLIRWSNISFSIPLIQGIS
jgi:hypothetical protein